MWRHESLNERTLITCAGACSSHLSELSPTSVLTRALLQSLLSDKTAEVVGENFLAISPTAGVPEPDFFEMLAPATALLASPVKVAFQPWPSLPMEHHLL